MEEVNEKNEETKEEIKEETKKSKKDKKMGTIAKVMIVISVFCILGCSYYLIHTQRMLKKYDVDSFKLGKFDIPTLNSALKSKKKLVVAYEEDNLITLKYDISKMSLNDVYEYLGKLSLDGFVIVNLEEYYMRAVHFENNIQVRIKARSNHLIIEYNIGIDYDEPDSSEKNKEKEKQEKKDNTDNAEESTKEKETKTE